MAENRNHRNLTGALPVILMASALLAVGPVAAQQASPDSEPDRLEQEQGDQDLDIQMPQTEQGQRVIINPPPILLPPPARPRGHAFDAAVDQVAPLSPAEIEAAKELLKQKQIATFGGNRPETTSRLFRVSLDTGAEIPAVEIAPGHVASIVMIDRYGNPWPIEGTPAVGNPDLFNTVVTESGNRNVITVSAKQMAGMSNLSVSLKDEGLPINIVLDISQRRTFLRADMQIQSVGPNTNPLTVTGQHDVPGPTASRDMQQFVDGVPPDSAHEVQTSDRAVRAWSYQGRLFLRTRHALISPAAEEISHGTAGLRVYRLALTPMVLYSDHGKTRNLRIELD